MERIEWIEMERKTIERNENRMEWNELEDAVQIVHLCMVVFHR